MNEVKPINLVTTLLDEMQSRLDLDTSRVDDMVLGCVSPVKEQGAVLPKVALQKAGWDESVPGAQVNRFCASGLDTFNTAAARVASGWEDLILAGGYESMSRVPMGSDGGPFSEDPETVFATNFVPQGIGADLIATVDGYSRDDVDALAVSSQKKAAAAQEAGYFDRSVVPVTDENGLVILERDDFIKPDTDMQILGGLRPSFAQMGAFGYDAVALAKYTEVEKINHVHTPGNSSGIVDGATAILIGNKEFGEKHGLTPRARIKANAKIGSEPTINLTGPVPVTEKILAENGMSINDIDLFEVNEAFAAVVLRFLQAFQVDDAKVNVNGGAIAMGHPLGATGAMIIGTLLDELERQDKEVGLATLCVAAGMGSATIIERV